MKEKLRPIFLFLIILIGWGLYRFFFKLPEWADELLAKPLIWLVPTILMVKIIEKQTLASLGLVKTNFWQNCLLGALLGLLLSTEVIITRTLQYGGVVVNPDNLSFFSVLLLLGLSFATAFVEETAFRGYIMNRLWKISNNELLANLTSTTLFVLVHVPLIIFVLHYSAYDLFTYALILFVSGAADAFIFGRTKTMAAPTTSHAVWNFVATVVK